MPYKILSNTDFSKGMIAIEDTINQLEFEGWDVVGFTDRFTVLHKPFEKIKRAYTKKRQENVGTTSVEFPKSGEISKGNILPTAGK